MNEPQRTFTQAELIEAARVWVRQNYKGVVTENRCQAILGILIDFVTDLVPKEEKPE